MNWSQRFIALGLALALLAGVSCTMSEGPTGVPAAQTVEQPSQLLGSVLDPVVGVVDGVVDVTTGVVGTVLDITGLLTCSEQNYDVTHKTIGPDGGTIEVGSHVLVIPKGALSQNVRIKAEQLRGSTNSVRFSPEGLTFRKSAVLTLSYGNCEDNGLPKTVVYTTEQLEVLEVLRSLDLIQRDKVTAPIDHFSRYAIAY